ncbi:hypothetical protein TNCV_3373641 [Trichonephila clavipes]|nr:hypothetical protein TNCV_3373641 [Trichonephila clavipes]
MNGLISVIRTLLHCQKRLRDLKRGRFNTNDAERSGCRNYAVIPENIKLVSTIILADRKLKQRIYPSNWTARIFRPTREASKTDHTEFFLRPGTHQK